MKRKMIVFVLICSLIANVVLCLLLSNNQSKCKERFYYSAEMCRGWFSTYLDHYNNGYSLVEPRIRAIASLESMTQLVRILDNSDVNASTLRFFIDMLIVDPEFFESNLAEIVEIIDLLTKNYSDANAYVEINRLLDGFRG